jgi:hypothetical protein
MAQVHSPEREISLNLQLRPPTAKDLCTLSCLDRWGKGRVPPARPNRTSPSYFQKKIIKNKQNYTQKTHLPILTLEKAEICQKKGRIGQEFKNKR